ncbi:TetR/AcrR family transcriptional regulator [Jiangella asiatica]|uniref:TetR/AcrR family transcriptional regulator n=1 Tax=Jiangella asiatica TaxID=2530372 RepID=A0A4R5D882_9ACTN|nr:TetR/AcrR family transcriptional regulator [Jiangella asiatica]TDE07941.1 TetR/AcrR family transcriptional regulator [Jiangella asiatica]
MTARPAATAPRGRPRDADRAARRDALLEAAMRQFLTHGYAATTIEEVAAQARVAKRTIYTTIGDKTDLFVAVVRRLGDRVVNAAAPDAGDPVADLHAFGVRLIRLMLSDEAIGLHRLVTGEAAKFPHLAARHYANGPRRYIVVLAQLLAALPPERLLGRPDDLDDLAEQLFTLLMGEAHRRRMFGLDPAPSDAAADAHVARTLRLVLTGPG